jgi:phosphomannomutase/phosphoglucomutase
MSIYKDCDILGIYPNEINEEIAYLIGRASGSMVPLGSCFAVGGDVRMSTPSLKECLIRGLIKSGVRVTDIGIVPTPLLYFAIDYLQFRGGIMVTASHNPAAYNGFKILLDKTPITTQDIKEIKKRVKEKNFRTQLGHFDQFKNYQEEYLQFLKKFSIQPKRNLTVVVDCGNGSYADLASRFLTSLGYQVISLYCNPDGSFPNRPPNPSQPEYLKTLCQTILQHQADIGIAFDGDGDRVVFADEKGQVLLPEHGMIFFIHHLFPKNPPGQKFVYDIKSSRIVADEVQRLGGIPLVERSGHTYIKTRLIREDAIMAGEISGHYFFREIHRDDGLFAAMVFLGYLSSHSSPLSKIIETYPSPHVTPDIRLQTRSHPDLMSILEKSHSKEENLTTIDGIRVDWLEGWGLLRKSVTEPVFTLRFEANQKEKLFEIVHRFLCALPDVEQEILSRLKNNSETKSNGNSD